MGDHYRVISVSGPSVRHGASGGLMAASSFEITLKAEADEVIRCVKITDETSDEYEFHMRRMGNPVNLKESIRKTLERFMAPGSERPWDPSKELEIELRYPDLLS